MADERGASGDVVAATTDRATTGLPGGPANDDAPEDDWIRSGTTAVVAEDATATSPGSGDTRRLTRGLVCHVLHTVGDFVYLHPRSVPWNDEPDALDLPDNPCRLQRSLVRRLDPRNELFFRAMGDVGDGKNGGEEPRTLRGTVSQGYILRTLRACAESSSLPDDLARQVASFLLVDGVKFDEVTMDGASSDRGDFPLASVLENDSNTWWISGAGTMRRGRGEEYLQFRLSPDGRIRRVSFFGVSIPPMPFGPLSVRHFRLDWSVDGEQWTKGGRDHTMETIGVDGIQAFELSPVIDAVHVRLVCLQNVFWAERDQCGLAVGEPPAHLDCVGLYHVRMK